MRPRSAVARPFHAPDNWLSGPTRTVASPRDVALEVMA
jgi:hypothetical protein